MYNALEALKDLEEFLVGEERMDFEQAQLIVSISSLVTKAYNNKYIHNYAQGRLVDQMKTLYHGK